MPWGAIRFDLTHNGPFDRIIICRAIEDGVIVLNPDIRIRQYPIKTLW